MAGHPPSLSRRPMHLARLIFSDMLESGRQEGFSFGRIAGRRRSVVSTASALCNRDRRSTDVALDNTKTEAKTKRACCPLVSFRHTSTVPARYRYDCRLVWIVVFFKKSPERSSICAGAGRLEAAGQDWQAKRFESIWGLATSLRLRSF